MGHLRMGSFAEVFQEIPVFGPGHVVIDASLRGHLIGEALKDLLFGQRWSDYVTVGRGSNQRRRSQG